MNYNELNTKYMKLQSIPFTKISIKEREELQEILQLLIDNPETSDHDLDQYYLPRHRAYLNDIQAIKSCIDEQISYQEAIIGLAQARIAGYKLKRKNSEFLEYRKRIRETVI